MFRVRVCSARHLFYGMLTAGTLLLCYRDLTLWPSSTKPDKPQLIVPRPGLQVELAAAKSTASNVTRMPNHRQWGPERNRNITVYVRPHQPTALLRPREPCVGDEFLVVVVLSAPRNIEQRIAIRSTWGQWITGDPEVTVAQGRRRTLQDETGEHVRVDDKPLMQPLASNESSSVTEPYYVIWEEYLDEALESLESSHRNKKQSVRVEKTSYSRTPRALTGRKVYRSSLKSYFGHINESLKYKLVFLLGREIDSQKTNNDIIAEHARYGDIVMEDFVDSYQNLTLKSLFLIKYMKDSCPKARFVAKIDDDIFLHVPNLQNTLLDKTLPDKLMLGCLFCNTRPITNPRSKWYTPNYMFNEDKWPNYLCGASYVIAVNLMKPLLEAAATTPLLHIEDVYITGILAKKIGVRPRDNVGFSGRIWPTNPCLYQNVTIGNGVQPDRMYKLWNLLHLEEIMTACKPLIARQLSRPHEPSSCRWT